MANECQLSEFYRQLSMANAKVPPSSAKLEVPKMRQRLVVSEPVSEFSELDTRSTMSVETACWPEDIPPDFRCAEDAATTHGQERSLAQTPPLIPQVTMATELALTNALQVMQNQIQQSQFERSQMREEVTSLRLQVTQRVGRNGRGQRHWTILLRNIPLKYTRDRLVAHLRDHISEAAWYIDYCYVPVDFRKHVGCGYAFLNFVSVEWARQFWDDVDVARISGVRLPDFSNSNKVLVCDEARVQGYNNNVNRLLDSPDIAAGKVPTAWLPRTYDSNGNGLDWPPPPPFPTKQNKKRATIRA